jgi:hypothetical protein
VLIFKLHFNRMGTFKRGHCGTVLRCRLALAALVLVIASSPAFAQSNTRIILSSGGGVPGRQGFVFGPFSNLAMNNSGQIAFLTRLRGSKADVRAVVKSQGVSFEVVAFEGLKAPVSGTSYQSFSAPSLNDSGQIAFTAVLNDDTPVSGVFRIGPDGSQVIATTRLAAPDRPDAAFVEFSAPVVTSTGNVLFGARTGGKQPGSGLYLWTAHGVSAVPLPAGITLKPSDLLVPGYARFDEATFFPRGAPADAATEQIFRTIANQNFEELKTSFKETDSADVLEGRIGEAPISLVFVLAEGDRIQTAMLRGEPTAPIKAKKTAKSPPVELTRIQGQTAGPRGNVIVAAAPQKTPSDLALYCYCEAELVRLTSPEEFLPVTEAAAGRPIISIASDGRRNVAFIAPAETGSDATSIFVVSIPQ